MKSKLIAIVLALFIGNALVIADGSLSGALASAPHHRLNITSQGILLDLFNAHGRSLVRGVHGDGFEVTYKTPSGVHSALALEGQIVQLQGRSARLRLAGSSATAIAQTADQALEIKSQFFFNESPRELVIVRTFRNISYEPLTLQMIKNHVDPKLTARDFVRAAQSVRRAQGAVCRITAGAFQSSDCSASYFKCPVGPICPWRVCPGPDTTYVTAQLLSEPGPELSSPTSLQPSGIVLQWSTETALGPLPSVKTNGEGTTITPGARNAVSIVIHVALE